MVAINELLNYCREKTEVWQKKADIYTSLVLVCKKYKVEEYKEEK